ncbi:uncharacterized protein LOC111132198 [Crassostrea virginica]
MCELVQLCSSVRIENASSVSEVDWTSCKETLPKNMTVTNLAFEELYWESKSCCSGNLTIKYRTGRGSIAVHSTQSNEPRSNTVYEGRETGTPLTTKTTRNRLRKEMEFSLLVICSYVNGCGLCSSLTIENASSVSEVDWTNCNDTRLYNMTVTNSIFEELYWELKSCCSGSLTIKYRSGRGSIAVHSTQSNEARSNTVFEGLETGTPLTTKTTRNRLRKSMASNSRITIATCIKVLS